MNEIDTVIRTEDMPEEEMVDLAMSLVEGDDNIVGLQKVKQNAWVKGEIEPQTITAKFGATSLPNALGKAYNARDTLNKHTSRTVTANPTGRMWSIHCHELDLYEMEIAIE